MTTHGELTRNASYTSEQPFIGSTRNNVLSFVRVREKFGATREEIAAGTGLKLSSVCGRVKELLDGGELVESGTSRIGLSGKGNSVVIAKEFDDGRNQRTEQGRVARDGETNRSASSSDSGRQAQGDSNRDRTPVQRRACDGPQHTEPTKLATPEAERIEAAIRFVTDERKGIETWRVGLEIMTLRRAGVLAWPDGDANQWVAAVEAAVKQGRLVAKDGKVKLATVVAEAKAVQQELF